MTYIPVTHKFVAVLNKNIPVGRLMNAFGHTTAGLVAMHPDLKEMRFDDYIDADGGVHASISDNPFIVLQAYNSNQLRTFRSLIKEKNMPCTDFTDTMIEGTYADQQERTKSTTEAELEYYCVVTFGPIDELNALTKKFSLWRG